MGPLIPLFWTSGDVCPGFRSQGGSLVCFLACVILRFTSGATPDDCIGISMADKPFQSTYLQTCSQAFEDVWSSNPRPSVPYAARISILTFDRNNRSEVSQWTWVWNVRHTDVRQRRQRQRSLSACDKEAHDRKLVIKKLSPCTSVKKIKNKNHW